MIYILMFTLSVIFTYCAECAARRNLKTIMVICSFIAIMFPCVLAGLRADSIGTDVSWYVTPYYNIAKQTNSLVEFINGIGIEPIYLTLVYILSKMTSDIGTVLFVLQLLVVLPTYITAFRYRKYAPMWLVMWSYYCLFYNYSLSLMRQFVACSLILFAFWYLQNKKYKKYIIWGIIASLFHSIAIFPVIILLILKKYQVLFRSSIMKILVAFTILVVMLNADSVVKWLVYSANFLPEKYYLRLDARTSEAGIGIIKTVLLVLLSFIPSIFTYKKQKKNLELNLSTFLPILGFITSLGGMVSSYLIRISYYFIYFYLITVPGLYGSLLIKSPWQKVLINGLFITWLFVFWIYIFAINNSFETLPYVFR
ncbi:EpsG family protein [Clostridium sp. BL-8]|uniref:EpsG family protein n=1 Tax=Clostridium sp. BL-8 TaxID=349938 RepID=UPI00098C3D70|nr:EpsG family protein [Clostridium sp. BL-8]OOM80323.1 hypothetical protein CLOBL_09790 [Clostridium sp. BL-8]